MRNHKLLVATLFSFILTACGGGGLGNGSSIGGSTGSTTSGSTPGAVPAAITLVASSAQLASNASSSGSGVILTAIVTDANNNVVADVPVTFSADSPAIQSNGTATDSGGNITAVLTTGGNSTLRTITVTAKVTGTSLHAAAAIDVVAANSGGGGSSTYNMNLVASSTKLLSTSATSNGVTLTAIVRDSNNNSVQGVTVAFSATRGVITATQPTTDASGVATAVLTTGGDTTPGNITVTATVGTSHPTVTITEVDPSSGSTVAGLTLISSSNKLPADAVSAANGVVVTAIVNDSSGNAVSGSSVTFAIQSGDSGLLTPGGTATTDASGTASVTLTTGGNTTAPRTIHVTATSGGITKNITISVTQPVVQAVRLGVLSAGTFTDGTITIGQSPLSPGASSGLTLNLVDTANSNQLYTGTATVNFTSPCVSQGLATISSPVTTSSGTVNASYQAKGCSGSDPITATTTVNGTALSATGTISVLSSPPSAIQFVSATPTLIGLQGSSQPGTSVVVFRVVNSAGGPVAGQKIKFSLDTNVGGLALTNTTGTSDSNGAVQATVNAGTVHTSVRVTAIAVDSSNAPVAGIAAAQSSSLTVSTGLPDQDSFSMSVGCFNIEGNEYDGTQTNVNILAADRFNNPVPDGTAISFQAEGGSIQPQCITSNGGCTVNFTSQSPRTCPVSQVDRSQCVTGINDHRYTILATTIGEESFSDTNGNGVFDDGDGNNFTDLPEAFLDANENGAHDANESFLDFNSSGTYNGASGNFTGVLCQATSCDAATSLHVRASAVIVMSGSHAAFPMIQNASPIDASSGAAINVKVLDSVGQVLPGGTTISATVNNNFTISGPATFTQSCTTNPAGGLYTFVVSPPPGATTAISGTFTVTVTTPKGNVTTESATVQFNPVPVIVTPPPPGTLASITFQSASPSQISIHGAGGTETSTLTYKLLSTTGQPIAGEKVTFSTDVSLGGLTVTGSDSATQSTSDSNGNVNAFVQAGTVHGVVRIIATSVSNSAIKAQSSGLTISTGLPDQNSFSIALSKRNIVGDDFVGETSTVTVLLSDRFHNPVPDNTAVSFTAEGGQISPSCLTTNGTCTATFTTGNPRTADHRYTILATAVGEESFTDLNGNGVYDAGEPFTDIGEAYVDSNESGTNGVGDRTTSTGRNATEEFTDFNNNGVYDGPSGNFTGALCNGASCDSAHSLTVSASQVIVMSAGENAKISINGAACAADGTASAINIHAGSGVSVPVTVSDTALQKMAGGTTIAATSNNPNAALAGTTSFTQADSVAPGAATFNFGVIATTTTGSGTFTVTVTPPLLGPTTCSAPLNVIP